MFNQYYFLQASSNYSMVATDMYNKIYQHSNISFIYISYFINYIISLYIMAVYNEIHS